MNGRISSILVVVALVAFGHSANIASQRASGSPREVDAATFLLAFQQGKAAQYKGFTVKGTGMNFNGTTEKNLALTVGALSGDGKVIPVKSLVEWITAASQKKTLMVWLRGPRMSRKPESPDPLPYKFSGTFAGEEMDMGWGINSGSRPIPVLVNGNAK